MIHKDVANQQKRSVPHRFYCLISTRISIMTTFVIVVFLLFVSVNSFSISLRGRLLLNGSSSKKIDSNSIAEVKLIEISSSRVICETHVRPIGFPIHFVLKFQPDDIDSMENVVIRATVRDLFGLTMYQNEFWTPIVPLGDDRTMFVDISMMTTKNRWPELIGINGEEAVERIKKETGSSC